MMTHKVFFLVQKKHCELMEFLQNNLTFDKFIWFRAGGLRRRPCIRIFYKFQHVGISINMPIFVKVLATEKKD